MLLNTIWIKSQDVSCNQGQSQKGAVVVVFGLIEFNSNNADNTHHLSNECKMMICWNTIQITTTVRTRMLKKMSMWNITILTIKSNQSTMLISMFPMLLPISIPMSMFLMLLSIPILMPMPMQLKPSDQTTRVFDRSQ